MKRLSPAEKIRQEILERLERGFGDEGSPLSWLIQKAVQRTLQEVLEREVDSYLGRERYERGEERASSYRNGYEPKAIKTSEGRIEVQVPQVRGEAAPFHSRVLPRGTAISERLQDLAVEMYVRGMSTRDIEDAFKDEEGGLLLSRQGVSEMTEELSKEFEAFRQRDLSSLDVVYLFLDGVYEHCRYQASRKEAILCAWGILASGQKLLLHLDLGNKESYECWRDFLRHMIGRGLRQPLLVTSDGCPGLIKAVNDCLPVTRRQRCLFHKMQNIVAKLPETAHREMIPLIKSIFDQKNREIAFLAAQQLIEKYSSKYPSAIKCLQDDLEASLAFLEFPPGHHHAIRTTNLIPTSAF
jgi:putative transposase